MEDKVESLVQFGLTKNEAKVYLALINLGSANAIEITKLSKVHRVNVYDVLERLREKGLISTIIQSNKRIFRPADPEQLLKLIKDKEELLNRIVPQLRKEFMSKHEKQQVHHFFGVEGVMRAYYMMLDQNATIYGLGGSGLNRNYLKHRHDIWNKERSKKKIHGKMIYYEFTRDSNKLGWKDPTMEVRYLPDTFRTDTMIDICGDLVINLLPIEDNIGAIVIENKILG